MSFIWPWVLLALVALPGCVYLYVLLQRKRARDAASLGALGTVQEGAAGAVGRRRHIAPIVFLIAVGLLAVASARPQITLPVPRMEGVVVLAMDVSSSMVADDVEPTRMDAAKMAAKSIVDRRPASARIGIVAFGEGGLIVNPPTDDDQALYATIDRLEPSSGTDSKCVALGWDRLWFTILSSVKIFCQDLVAPVGHRFDAPTHESECLLRLYPSETPDELSGGRDAPRRRRARLCSGWLT